MWGMPSPSQHPCVCWEVSIMHNVERICHSASTITIIGELNSVWRLKNISKLSLVVKRVKLALLLEQKIKISFKIRYVIALNLQILELKKLFESDILLPRYWMSKSGKSTTLATTFYFYFFLNPVANMVANYVCMK